MLEFVVFAAEAVLYFAFLPVLWYNANKKGGDTMARLSDPVTILKGVGPAKAKALIIKFGTLQRIGEATRAELMSVKGITEEIANEIIKAFKGE